MYIGLKDKGVFFNDKQLPLIKNTPLKSLQRSLFLKEYGYFLGQVKLDIKVVNAKSIHSILSHGVRSLGSFALDICQVARGGVDFYFEIWIHTWDLAGASVIVRESGGVVIGYRKPERIDK